MMTPREIAEIAFCQEEHPLLDKWRAANNIAEHEGYGVDLSELIAFAELLPPEDLQ